jgi:REP element-mobilizing transposase RayT
MKIIPIEEANIEIIEWCPGDNAVNPPEQVHVLIELPNMVSEFGFAIRLKTRAAAERFANSIRKHADNVWPKQ